MSKAQIIKEQRVVIETFEADYADVIRQRDKATKELDRIEGMKRLQAAAKERAEIQEKVDGIKAGLIPTSELRKAFDTLEVDADWVAFVTYRFDRDGDLIQKAISDVLTAKPKPTIGSILREINTGSYFGGGYVAGSSDGYLMNPSAA